MTQKPTLELTWIEKEGRLRRTPRIRLLDSERSLAGNSQDPVYQGMVQVCPEPTCACCSLQVQYQSILPDGSIASPGLIHEFWLDTWEKSVVLTPELEENPELLRLANLTRAELSSSDWEQLYQWFRAEKLEIIQTTPTADIDRTNLPAADNGRMVGFVEVFPRGLALEFTLDDRLWVVDEQYCVQPKCECKGAILSFLQYQDATGRRIVLPKNPPALRYDYGSEAARELEPVRGIPDVNLLLAALKAAHPSLNQQLELRHCILQAIYAQHFIEHLKTELQSHSKSPRTESAKKVGRNEPCPCGSGKKFKHCCLNRKPAP